MYWMAIIPCSLADLGLGMLRWFLIREKLDHYRSNGVIQMILVTKHLDVNTKQPKVLLYYDFANDITNEEEEIFF